jgi:hypothetical protein
MIFGQTTKMSSSTHRGAAALFTAIIFTYPTLSNPVGNARGMPMKV